jgi:transcriptional regulator with XRE-family HTH domain
MGQVNIKKIEMTDEERRIGALLFKARKDLGLSQQAVANASGVSRITVSRYENTNWKIKLNFSDLSKIADALDIPQTALIECLDMKSVKKTLKRRERVAAKALKEMKKANSLITEAQVAHLVLNQAAKALRESQKLLRELLETMKFEEEESIESRAEREEAEQSPAPE